MTDARCRLQGINLESIIAYSTRIICTAFIAVSYATKNALISVGGRIILICRDFFANTAKFVGSAGSTPVNLAGKANIIVEVMICDALVAGASYFAVVTLTDVTGQACTLVINKAG